MAGALLWVLLGESFMHRNHLKIYASTNCMYKCRTNSFGVWDYRTPEDARKGPNNGIYAAVTKTLSRANHRYVDYVAKANICSMILTSLISKLRAQHGPEVRSRYILNAGARG